MSLKRPQAYFSDYCGIGGSVLYSVLHGKINVLLSFTCISSLFAQFLCIRTSTKFYVLCCYVVLYNNSLVKKYEDYGKGWNMFKNDLMSNCPQVTAPT